MADQPPQFNSEAIDWRDIGDQLTAGVIRSVAKSDAVQEALKVALQGFGQSKAMAWDLTVDAGLVAGKATHLLEEALSPFIAAFIQPIVAGLFGVEVDQAEFTRRMSSGQGAAVAQAIVKGFMEAVAGESTGEVEPSADGATRIASAAVAASLETSINALIPEIASQFLPFEMGHLTDLLELPENIIRTLGVSRLVRRAIGPLVTATCTTPLQWQVNKKYRPTLLGAASVIRQGYRGQWDWEDVLEELRRDGYSEARIAALLNEQRKFFGVSDVRRLNYRGEWSTDRAVKELRDQGFDEDAAATALRIEGLKRIEELEDAETTAIIAAYVNRDIDDGELDSFLAASVHVEVERTFAKELAGVKRDLNRKFLTLSQVEAMVKSEVLAVVDYREAARREGYSEDAVTALELQLRAEMDKAKSVADHRAELEAERAAEKKAKADAAAAKAADVAKARELAQRGGEADLEAAAVRGLIPIDRVVEVYRAHYDADTVGILQALLEAKRADYVAQQKAHDDAAQRGKARGIDVGALERLVLEDVLNLDDYRARLASAGFSADDAALLARGLAVKQAALAAEKKKRDEAGAVAKKKSIDLSKFELLVRRGHRSLDEYRALLASLGYDDAAVAGMVEWLQLQIADDTAARQARENTSKNDPQKGLTLEQIRRAVILGLTDESAFVKFLIDNRYTSDAQVVLLAELRTDVAEAEAARQRREQTGGPVDAPRLPTATVARAARLGLIPPDVYQARLERDGYSADDIALDMDLLTLEIAEVQATREKKNAPPSPPGPKDLTLADVERAVKAGQATTDDYEARAIGLGYSQADAQLLTDVLEQELATARAAKARREQIAFALSSAGESLDALEARVKSGELTFDDYGVQLAAWGYSSDDAALLGNLLVFTLSTAKPAAGS